MDSHFQIRKALPSDLPRMLEIYQTAREFMTSVGNARQWAERGWPPKWLIERDIQRGKSFVCLYGGKTVGCFFFDSGHRIDPTYSVIKGQWLGDDCYGVVHRIASDRSVKGIGRFCLQWAHSQCGHLRVDTHDLNLPMKSLLLSMGFVQCGEIHIEEDEDPRIAFELL